MTIDVLTEKQGGEAKQDAFDKATEQATQKMAEELLGADKASRYWASLKPKLLKNSARYLLFIKGSAPQVGPNGQTKITVNMRISSDNLETLLREEGVLSSGTLRVLPLVEINDSRGVKYDWWADDGTSAGPAGTQAELFKRFLTRLTAKFKAKNIYVLDPTSASFRLSVPAAYRTGNLRHEDQMLLAQYLKADVVISGRVESMRGRDGSELKLNYDLQMWQAKSGRTIADVQRAEPLGSENPRVMQALLDQTSVKVVEELTGKLVEAETSGNLNLNLVRVAVNGTLNYRQQSEFKRQLGQVREIKVLRERLFEPGRVVFEAETAVTGQDLARAIQRTRFALYNVAVEGSQDDSLALSVKALSSASAQ